MAKGGKPTMTSVTRDGYKWTSKWKRKKNSNDDYPNKQQIGWQIEVPGKNPHDKDKDAKGDDTSNKQTFGEFGLSRQSFYPCGGPKASNIKCRVRGSNGQWGDWSKWCVYSFHPPRMPSVSWKYDQEAHKATVTIATDAGLDNQERYDTAYRIEVRQADGSARQWRGWTASTSTGFDVAVPLADYEAALVPGSFVEVRCWAVARGMAGDSATSYASYWVGIPAPAALGEPQAPDQGDSGRVYVAVTAGAATKSLQLERRTGSEGTWSEVKGAAALGNATLSDPMADARPAKGVRVFYRVRSECEQYATYSEPVEAECLFEMPPTMVGAEGSPKAGTCEMLSLEPGGDGTSAEAVVGWDGAVSGIEMTWSQDPDAWRSTEQPEQFEAHWIDAESADESGKYGFTTSVRISPLDGGARYYVRARVRYEEEDVDYYSAYTLDRAVIPTAAPANVAVNAPSWVARGEDVPVSWTFDGGALQTAYHVMPQGGSVEYAGGEDPLGYAVIPAEAYGDADSVEFSVTVVTGGGSTESGPVVVGIADAPQCEVRCGDVTVRPGTFEVCSHQRPDALLCTCTALGTGRDLPDRDDDQAEGETAWTGSMSPGAWEATTWGSTSLRAALEADLAAAKQALSDAQAALPDGGDDAQLEVSAAQAAVDAAQAALDAHPADGAVYRVSLGMPDDADLVDGGRYVLSVTPMDTPRGLSGDAAACGFEVAWAHQAPEPSDAIEVVPDAESRSVTITLPEPDGWAEGDVYDVYRKSGPVHELAYAGAAPGMELTDPYAPFGVGVPLSYRVAVRTPDGDVAYADYPYEMAVPLVRVDFGGQSLELPWNIGAGDDYGKDFEARAHMDGTTAGYFGPATGRSASYSSDVLAIDDAGTLDAVHALGGHAGACFLRTPNGHAFQCNAEPSIDMESAAVAGVSLSAERVGLTDAYRIPNPEPEES